MGGGASLPVIDKSLLLCYFPEVLPLTDLWLACLAFAFLCGIAAVWLYAAIRPRFGAGLKTALIAGIAVWFFYRFLGAVAEMNMGLSSQRMIMTAPMTTG